MSAFKKWLKQTPKSLLCLFFLLTAGEFLFVLLEPSRGDAFWKLWRFLSLGCHLGWLLVVFSVAKKQS